VRHHAVLILRFCGGDGDDFRDTVYVTTLDLPLDSIKDIGDESLHDLSPCQSGLPLRRPRLPPDVAANLCSTVGVV
jgi:hypothetical protein